MLRTGLQATSFGVMKNTTTPTPFLHTHPYFACTSALTLLINVDLIGVQPLRGAFMPG
jgi:hypothetical protein